MNKRSIKFSFTNSRDLPMTGIIDMPEDEPRLFGVFAPCFTCVKESHAAHKICRGLAARSIAMLRFDVTGMGESKGDFADTNFSTRIDDIVSACRALGKSYPAPQLLIGHSMSGTAALVAVNSLPSLRVLATLGSPRDPNYTIEKFRQLGIMQNLGGGVLEITVAPGKKVRVKESFVDDFLSQNVAAETAKYDGQLYVFHAPHDKTVAFDSAEVIYSRATCAKELVSLSEDATHLLEHGDADAEMIADTLSEWFAVHA